MAFRRKLIEQPETAPKLPNTVYEVGEWLEYNGAGEVQQLQPGGKVEGLNLEPILATSQSYAVEGYQLHYDGVDYDVDRWFMPVTTGNPNRNMIGSTFDVDAADSKGLDVTAFGSQFTITQVLDEQDLVEVKVNRCCDATVQSGSVPVSSPVVIE